jgi:uncharacterized membrane protein YgcG
MSSEPHLSTSLSVAETLMLLFPRRSDSSDLLKITFSELCLLGVLEVKLEYEYASRHSDRLTGYKYVYLNRTQCEQAPLLAHQVLLTSLFENEEGLKMTLFARRLGKSLSNRKEYKQRYIFDSLKERTLLKETFESSKHLELYSYQNKGKEEVKNIELLLEKAERNLPMWMTQGKKEEIRSSLEELGKYMLLLPYVVIKREVDWSKLFPDFQELLLSTHGGDSLAVDSFSTFNFLSLGGFSLQSGLDVSGFSYGGGDFGGGGASDDY